MRILITGGTGFIGTRVAKELLRHGHEVAVTGRSGVSPLLGQDGFRTVTCDTTQPGPWQDEVARSEVVINLAGRSIFTRWNDAKRAEIDESRILTTEHVVQAIPDGGRTIFLSASAAGFYGERGDDLLGEDEAGGSGFLADLCWRWESEAMSATSKGARVVVMRFGAVLGRGGGALETMLTPYKLCLGGPLGTGRQWFPWIHIDDLVSGIVFLIGKEKASGPVNFCAPYVARNSDFSKALAGALGRPAPFSVPLFALKMILGDLGDEITFSQRVVPERLSEWGFRFSYPSLEAALGNLVQSV